MKPLDLTTFPVVALLEHREGRINFRGLEMCQRRDDVFALLRAYSCKKLAVNFLYLPTKNRGRGRKGYVPPKFRMDMYLDVLRDFEESASERGVEVFFVHAARIYGKNPLPSRSTLAGLSRRFKALSEYITGVEKVCFLEYDWKVQMADLFDALATALGLYFAVLGRTYVENVGGLQVHIPLI